MAGIKKQFRQHCLAFGVLTPGAAERAALKKDYGPYAIAVVGGEALDIENGPIHGGQHAQQPSYSQY
jgi:hypothetical protein